MHRHGGPLLAPPAPAGALRQNRRVRRCLLGARQETALWCFVGSVRVGGGYWVPLIQDVRAVPPAWFVGCYLCVAPDRTLRVGGQRRGVMGLFRVCRGVGRVITKFCIIVLISCFVDELTTGRGSLARCPPAPLPWGVGSQPSRGALWGLPGAPQIMVSQAKARPRHNRLRNKLNSQGFFDETIPQKKAHPHAAFSYVVNASVS